MAAPQAPPGDEPLGPSFHEALLRVRTEEELNVCFQSLSPEGAQALARAIHSNRLLKTLELTESSLGPRSIWGQGGLQQVEALAAGLKGSSVITLVLATTGLGDGGASALAAALRESSLKSIDLRENQIGVLGARDLAEGLKSTSVTSINLSKNHVGDEGMGALAAVLKETSLKVLDLAENGIGGPGWRALGASLASSSLTTLNLRSNNGMGEVSAHALLAGLRDSAVLDIDYDALGVSNQTLGEIQAVLEAHRARTFVLQLEVQRSGSELQLKFRTLAGTVAALLTWSVDTPVQELPHAVLASMQSSGQELPFEGLSAIHLKIVRRDGSLLGVTRTAASLAQQLGLEAESCGRPAS